MDVIHTVKVQPPIYTNDAEMPWLVYDQLKSRVCHIPDKQIPKHVKTAMNGCQKGFFHAKWDEQHNTWLLQRKVKWRYW